MQSDATPARIGQNPMFGVGEGSIVAKGKKFVRREYENAALVATRQTRQLVLFWARRCRKSTNLGAIAFDAMSAESNRTVIAASASLLLGTELVGMTLSATEQAAIVTNEAAAVRQVMVQGAEDRSLDFKCADMSTGMIVQGLSAEDFADLYKSSKLELRLYFDRTSFSRLKIIAPNPATARGWAGFVLRDEAGYTPAGLETELRIATKPITDTDPTFKIIYASNLSRDDRHPFFEDSMPPHDLELPVNPMGNFYRGQTGMMVHRVTLADAYAAGHVLFDDKGNKLTYEEFCAQPANKLGLDESYRLNHKSGGSAAVDLIALLSAQRRGAEAGCVFVFAESDAEFTHGMGLLRRLLGSSTVGIGFDVATTTGDTSNPSSITITEKNGTERSQRLVICWKERKPQIVRERINRILDVIEQRPAGGRARRFCIDATNERYFAEETADLLRARVPVELVVSSAGIHPPGYQDPTNFKTYLGDIYSAAINDNHYACPPDPYFKKDHRIVVKDSGRYACTPEADGAHGDTFDSGKLAEYALVAQGGNVTADLIF
jgi:hypothetical protein